MRRHEELKATMQWLVGIFRTASDLDDALARIEELQGRWEDVRVQGPRAFNPSWDLVFELRNIGDGEHAAAVPTAIATVAAFVVGYASIAFFIRWLGSHSTALFVVYRVLLGVLVLSLVATGTIH